MKLSVILQRSCSYYFGAPDSPKCSNIRDLLIHHVKNQVPISKQHHIILRRPICKDGRSPANLQHSDVVLDEEPISRGSYSDTYMAVMKVLGRCVTVQKCHSDYLKTQSFTGAEILRKSSHHNIVEFIGLCVDVMPMYIITEPMFGGVLKHYLQEKKGTINASHLINFSRQAAGGMSYLASASYVHRDLKASSCMVDVFGSNVTLKISDFRLAKKTALHKCVLSKEECRTVAVRWTAPEVKQTNYSKH